MVLLETADCAAEVASLLVERTPGTLSDTAKLIYKALCWVSVEVARERDYSPNVTEVSWFAPAESVALAVGIHPATLYRRLPELVSEGLVAVRGHFCTLNGRTRSDGSVWTVRLSPTRGSAARVPYDHLHRQYRSLGADIDSGRTAWAQMRESKAYKSDELKISYITRWALSLTNRSPVTSDSRSIDLETIFDVRHAEPENRADAVYQAALAISRALGDQDSTRFYCRLLWSLLRLRLRDGEDFFDALYLMVKRAQADVLEGFSRRGGAVLTSRLKSAPWFDLSG
jgi:hypothetical protein